MTTNAESKTEAPTCRVTVRLFSVLKEKIGKAKLEVDLDAPADGADLLDDLEARHPAVADHRTSVRLAVNQEYVPTSTTLEDGDEVALITPVSGG
jgi:molybdopterin converting factor subunit 1